ncbi:hypothetical protein PsYK624_094230 [Phanerochaete sordida]|uniref:Uncharacterized protein n=1 Tax=Phanerochaete sordida TaxID=48140 RepID=A0A9P3LG38_9APHY|nr:hypothetical protein PsYK624_094230 [Phanerochaete sordida]
MQLFACRVRSKDGGGADEFDELEPGGQGSLAGASTSAANHHRRCGVGAVPGLLVLTVRRTRGPLAARAAHPADAELPAVVTKTSVAFRGPSSQINLSTAHWTLYQAHDYPEAAFHALLPSPAAYVGRIRRSWASVRRLRWCSACRCSVSMRSARTRQASRCVLPTQDAADARRAAPQALGPAVALRVTVPGTRRAL